MPEPLPPLTASEILIALDAIWNKATNDQRPAIDALADDVRQRGVGGGEHPVSVALSLAAGSMIPPPLPPPPSAHAATDWGTGGADGGDESGDGGESEGEIEGGWARYL